MLKFANKRLIVNFGVFCSLLLLTACASSVSKESAVEKRVTERWDLLFSGDLAGAYEYLSPGYRSSVSSVQYQRSILIQPVKWTSATYKGRVCEETVCKVKISVGFTVYGALPGVKSFSDVQDIEESWMLVSGKWYLVPEQ